MSPACVHGGVHVPEEYARLQATALPGPQTRGGLGQAESPAARGPASAVEGKDGPGVGARVRARAEEPHGLTCACVTGAGHPVSCACGECRTGWAGLWRDRVLA